MKVTNVYECTICGAEVMSQGLARHMKTHGLTGFDYAEVPITDIERLTHNPDIIIDFDHDKYLKGKVIAKWIFEVKGPYNTRLAKGDVKRYRLWVSKRIRYVNRRYKASLGYPTYLEDYDLINSSSSSL